MAVCIRTELQKTNDALLAINAMACQGIEDGIRLGGQGPHWADALEYLIRRALDEIGAAEERLNALVAGVAP